MGDSRHLITRRETLKRGAIVGGSVLWVTPAVQTLRMGSAHAAPVSADTCKMTLELVYCRRYLGNPIAYVAFRAYIPPGCPCNPPPAWQPNVSYPVWLDYGGTRTVMDEEGDGYWSTGADVGSPLVAYAQCINTEDSSFPVINQSDSIEVTQAMLDACTLY